MDEYKNRILRAISTAFPAGSLPSAEELTPVWLADSYPFEYQELQEQLAGTRWTDLPGEFIETHGDWLIWLTPKAFRYYVPAWLVYALDWENSGYAGQWISSVLAGPFSESDAQLVSALTPEQRSLVMIWLQYLVLANPNEDVGYLDQKGRSLQNVNAGYNDLT